MYGEYDPELDEDDLDEIMTGLKRANIHPVEIYRGSMIFHEKSYGYIYIPDIGYYFKEWPHDMTEKKFIDIAEENGGETTIIHAFEQDMMCACFPTLEGAENFLAKVWSVTSSTPTPLYTPTPTLALFEVEYPLTSHVEAEGCWIDIELNEGGWGLVSDCDTDTTLCEWDIVDKTAISLVIGDNNKGMLISLLTAMISILMDTTLMLDIPN